MRLAAEIELRPAIEPLVAGQHYEYLLRQMYDAVDARISHARTFDCSLGSSAPKSSSEEDEARNKSDDAGRDAALAGRDSFAVSIIPSKKSLAGFAGFVSS
jgi:hypothetical protein